MMKALGERDSEQETMHHLLSLKLYSSTFNVKRISLEGSRRINMFSQTDHITEKSLLDIYENRVQFIDKYPNILIMNFVEFVTKFRVVKGELTNQLKNFIPKFFPAHSSNLDGRHFGQVCKYHLLRYKP